MRLKTCIGILGIITVPLIGSAKCLWPIVHVHSTSGASVINIGGVETFHDSGSVNLAFGDTIALSINFYHFGCSNASWGIFLNGAFLAEGHNAWEGVSYPLTQPGHYHISAWSDHTVVLDLEIIDVAVGTHDLGLPVAGVNVWHSGGYLNLTSSIPLNATVALYSADGRMSMPPSAMTLGPDRSQLALNKQAPGACVVEVRSAQGCFRKMIIVE